MPLEVLKEKLTAYVEEGHIPETKYDEYVRVFEQMQGIIRESNVFADPDISNAKATEEENRPMSRAELKADLARRENLMQQGDNKENSQTDQWRIYEEAIKIIDKNEEPLRLFLQASAGTGKSFLLETLYLWCYLNGFSPQACAPTGLGCHLWNL